MGSGCWGRLSRNGNDALHNQIASAVTFRDRYRHNSAAIEAHLGDISAPAITPISLIGASTMQDVSKLTREQLEALVASMAKQAERKITLKITAPKLDEKTNTMKGTSGAISLYGLGRFPITLYRSQWERLAAAMPDVAKFIDANAALLSTKD